MDLYEPLYVPRPTVEPELFASLRPQTYSGSLEEKQRRGLAFGAAPAPAAGMPNQPQLGAIVIKGTDGRALKAAEALLRDRGEKAKDLDFRQGVASAATASQLGEYFRYHIDEPVS